MSDEDVAPLAFVVMPFDIALEPVYQELIKTTLEHAGFKVERADDLVTSRNILDDIVAKLVQADLIVADLTDLNPNVFYELGLAHALNGKVLMLTQDVSSLPFDLQSYRVVEYDTHFSRFGQAQQRLSEFARTAQRGELAFGSPVSDFTQREGEKGSSLECLVAAPESPASPDDGEPGLLDKLVDLYEAGATMTNAVELITAATEKVGQQVVDGTAQLTEANAGDDPAIQARAAQAIIRQISQHTNEYARFLNEQNSRYELALSVFDTSLEAALRAQPPTEEEPRKQLREYLETLSQWDEAIVASRESTVEYADTLRKTPRVERYSSKAFTQAHTQLQRLIANMDKTSSMLARIRKTIASILDEDE